MQRTPENKVFKRKGTVVALATALATLIPVASALASYPLPAGQSDVVLNLKGPSTNPGSWTGTLNGDAIQSDKGMNTGIYQELPTELKKVTLNYEGFSQNFGSTGVAFTKHGDIAISVNSKNLPDERTKAIKSFSAIFSLADTVHNGVITANTSFRGMDLVNHIDEKGKTVGSDLIGVRDFANADATYSVIEQNFNDIRALGTEGKSAGAGGIYGTDFRNGMKKVGVINETFNDLQVNKVFGVYGLQSNLDLGAVNLALSNLQTDTLFGIYALSANIKDNKVDMSTTTKDSFFTLQDGLNITLDHVAAEQFVGVYLNADKMTLLGDIHIQARDCDFSTKGVKAHNALYVKAPQSTHPLLIQGDITFDVQSQTLPKEGYGYFDLSAVDIREVGQKSDVILDGSHVSLSLNGVASPRIRALMIQNNALKEGSLILRNGADVSLRLENVNSWKGKNTEDPPSAILLGTNAKVQLVDSSVNVTLRAHEGNAFNDQSLFGIAAQKPGTSITIDEKSKVTVTLEGRADQLGLGKSTEALNQPIKESGSIYGVGLNTETTHDIKGDVVLQLGSNSERFSSDEKKAMKTAFGNFTQVALSEGSTLFIDKTQSTIYQGDTEMGSSPEFKYGKSLGYGILASKGALSVTAEKDKNVGINLGNTSAITADSITFKTNSDAATSHVTVNGQGTLAGKSVAIEQNAAVVVEQGRNGVSSNNALGEGLENKLVIKTDAADGFINQGSLTLNKANVEFNNDSEGVLNLGSVQTEGTQGYSHVLLGAGEYTIDRFTGQKKAIVMTDMKANQGVNVKSEGDLSIVATGASNDQYASVDKAAQALVDKVTVETPQGDKATIQAEVMQGALNDAMSVKIDATTGEIIDKVVQKNTTFDALGSVTALTVLQWRHEMTDLNRRMGQLRDAAGDVGAWARTYGTKQTYGAQDLSTKNTSIQIGSDWQVGQQWTVGAAFDYTDGSMDYSLGSGDTNSYGLGLYGTWLADNGLYVDLIAKYNRLSSDVKLGGNRADFDNNAMSLSAEFGWHLPVGSMGFVEPQAQLTYGRIFGKDFTMSNRVKMSQEDMESLIARAGVRAGLNWPQKNGSFYAHASVLHDFNGDFEVTGRLAGHEGFNSVQEDIGGTWYEMGLGAHFSLTEHTYTYVDVSKTFSGEVKEDWRWNVGLRYTF